jgi:predicted glycosyltransferase
MTAPRLLFYVQHLLGIGHFKRAAIFARALGDAGFAVTLLTGGMPSETEPLGGIDIVQLPPVQARDASFKELVDEHGRLLDDDLRARRRDRALAALAVTQPEVVLLESYPFGRRAFRFEILPLIAATRRMTPRPLIVSSVRDVLVLKPDPARAAAIVAAVQDDIDLVLVHGDPSFITLEESFPAATELADKLFYTGYVRDLAHAAESDQGNGEVVVSAGGGAVGLALLRCALAARPLSPLLASPWRLLTGPNLAEEERRALAAAAPSGVTVERYRADFPALLRRCRLSISQAGYNTILDVLGAGARAIVVPFAAAQETEQRFRAERLARRGALWLVPEEELTPSRLAAAIAAALAAPLPSPVALDLDGAQRGAAKLWALAAARTRRTEANPPVEGPVA